MTYQCKPQSLETNRADIARKTSLQRLYSLSPAATNVLAPCIAWLSFAAYITSIVSYVVI